MRWLLPQELIQYYLIIIIYITVLVTTVTFTPSGDNNVVDIIKGQTQTFICTTNPIRPAAWILWYMVYWWTERDQSIDTTPSTTRG